MYKGNQQIPVPNLGNICAMLFAFPKTFTGYKTSAINCQQKAFCFKHYCTDFIKITIVLQVYYELKLWYHIGGVKILHITPSTRTCIKIHHKIQDQCYYFLYKIPVSFLWVTFSPCTSFWVYLLFRTASFFSSVCI